jgi:hypothetical protein
VIVQFDKEEALALPLNDFFFQASISAPLFDQTDFFSPYASLYIGDVFSHTFITAGKIQFTIFCSSWS